MKALITGIAGQDGSYLSDFLLEKGYEVHGMVLESDIASGSDGERWLDKSIRFHVADICDAKAVEKILVEEDFDEIYNLAAMSNVATSFHAPSVAFTVNAASVLNFLEVLRTRCPRTRFYQASSSELFGGMPEYSPQNEHTPFYPRSPYGVSKLAAHWLVINYREAYGLQCCSGILFNHESPRRKGEFVTKKIISWVKKYSKGEHNGPLVLGNLSASRDWGHAKDFVQAMWRMLNSDKLEYPFKKEPPQFKEYVVGTGSARSIKEFIEKALAKVGKTVEWKVSGTMHMEVGQRRFDIPLEEGFSQSHEKIITSSPDFWRPAEVNEVKANSRLIRNELGWSPQHTIDEIIEEMLEHME